MQFRCFARRDRGKLASIRDRGKMILIFSRFSKVQSVEKWLVLQYGENYLWGRGLCSFSPDHSCSFPLIKSSKKSVLSKGIFHFDHNFSRSAWIEIRFGTVAKLEKLNNFPTGRPEVDVTKKSTFRCTPLKRGGT